LWTSYGVALGGEIAPAIATTYSNVIGLVMPPLGAGTEEKLVNNRPSGSATLNSSCG
jgi:hypothetical protein